MLDTNNSTVRRPYPVTEIASWHSDGGCHMVCRCDRGDCGSVGRLERADMEKGTSRPNLFRNSQITLEEALSLAFLTRTRAKLV